MPEAIFTLTADITPQLDQRELENQAQLLSGKLKNILGKNPGKVGIRGDTRSFNELKNQVQDTSRFTQGLQRQMGSLKNTMASVPQRAREGFLKLTDALNVTKRGIVGFGGSIRDTIRDTKRFKESFENIVQSRGVFEDLSGGFATTIAQIRSGTSTLDQFAARGDHLAQMFLPLTRTSAAAQLNLEGLQQTLEGVAANFGNAFRAAGDKVGNTFDASSVSTGSLNANLNHLQRTFLGLGKNFKEGSSQQRAYFDTFTEAKAKGGPDDFIKGLVQQRDAMNKLAGPMGRVKVALGSLTAEERKAGIAFKRDANQELVKMEAQFPGTVKGLDRFTARLRNAKDSVISAGKSFTRFRSGLANLIPGENIGLTLAHAFDTKDAMGNASTFFEGMSARFTRFRAQGMSVGESVGKALRKTFPELNVVNAFKTKLAEVTKGIGNLATNAHFAAGIVRLDLADAFKTVQNTVNSATEAWNKGTKAVRNMASSATETWNKATAAYRKFASSPFAKEMVASFVKVRAGIRQMGEGIHDVTEVFSDMGRTALNGLKKAFAATAFGGAALKKVEELRARIGKLGDDAVSMGKKLADNVGPRLTAGFEMAKAAGAKFGRQVVADLTQTGEKFKKLGAQAVQFGSDVGRELKEAFSGTKFGKQVIADLTQTGDKLKKLGAQASKFGSDVGRELKEAFSGTKFGTQVISDLTQSFKKLKAGLGIKDAAEGPSKIAEGLARVRTAALALGRDAGHFADPFVNGFQAIKTGLSQGLAAFNNSRFAAPMAAGLEKIRGGFATVTEGARDAGQAVLQKLAPVGQAIVKQFQPALTKVSELFAGLKEKSGGSLSSLFSGTKAKAAPAVKDAAGKTESEAKKGGEAIVQGTISGMGFDSVEAFLDTKISGMTAKAVIYSEINGRKIGASLTGGVAAGIASGAKAVDDALAKAAKGAPTAKVDETRPAIQQAAPVEGKTVQAFKPAADGRAAFVAQGKASMEAMGQGMLDGGNFEQVVGGGIQNHINNITGRIAPAVDAAGRKIGTTANAGILSGVGVNASEVEAKISEQVGGIGAKAGSSLGRGVLGAIKAPFKIVKDVLGTTVRAGMGKGPAEDVGKVGKAAGLALMPLRLFNKAVGAVLGAGLQVGTAALKVAATAFTAFVGAAIATGVQFNSLQAVIRATLPVILGSAAASEKLLGEINELNDTSPFARSAFLELTRVLAGFGVEAAKITPLIDAIQQAVAATGGGEADLLELGQAFARLQSQGRLSLDVIQSFSSRGIDVIGILGQEFHKTQGEVRDMISGGLIPANEAIDALTRGLKTKFDGATDAVSKNLPGALDRVKAKTRDFGAELTRAFVSPTGGGAVIDLLNAFATVVNKITKSFLPLLRPALEAVAGAISTASAKAVEFANTLGSFEAGKLKSFAGGLDGLLGPLAALVAFLPGLLGILPVVGPMFTALFAGIPTATIAIGAFLLTLAPVREALGSLAKDLAPIGGELLPKISAAFKALGEAVGPIIGVFIKALGPIIKQIAATFGELMDQLVPIFNAFKRLFTALEPVISILKHGMIAQWQQLQLIFKLLGPVIEWVINLVAAIVEKVKPFLTDFAEFLDKAHAAIDIEDIFIKIKDAVVWAVDKLKAFVDFFNKILKFLGINEIDLGLNISGQDEVKRVLSGNIVLTNEQTDALKEQNKAADGAAQALADKYKAAQKEAETAQKLVDSTKDQIKQQMATYQQALDPLIEAAKAIETAHTAQADAAAKAKEASANVTQMMKDQARALRDVISPTDELAQAQRGLIKTQNSLRALDRQEIELQEKLKDLRGEEAADSRAGLDRAIERAKIALNKARKAENDLIKEGNDAQTTSISLAGLSLDQIKLRLRAVQASLKDQKEVRGDDKDPAATADDKASARMDVEDAEQGVKDATKARKKFDLDTTNEIRDTEEQITGIEGDRADLRLEEQAQLTHINDLRKGETAQQAIIKDFEEKIKDARKASETAARAVTDAITASTIAELDLKAKSAGVRGDYEAQFGFQQQINALKKGSITFDQQTEDSLTRQSGTIVKIIGDLGRAQTEASRLQEIAKNASVESLRSFANQHTELSKQVKQGVGDPKVLVGLKTLGDDMETALNNISVSGGIVDKAGAAVTLSAEQIAELLRNIETTMVFEPNSNFRDILRRYLTAAGLSIPRFAGGYAPGEVHRGMNDGAGLVRMFEFGKEAVLPLTRKLDMFRVVNNPSVLPRILDALPKISIPTASRPDSDVLASLPRLVRPTGPSNGAANLSPAKRSPASSRALTDAARRKEHREFAGSVGAAVKTAVKEALSESDTSFGSDIDINVQPSSNNEVLIAREVRRQVEKALGRW